MIKFIDLNNNYTFDGTSYVKHMDCPNCKHTQKINYGDDEICENCSSILHENEITGPHHIFWFDDQQSTNIYYIKEICVLTDNKHGYVDNRTNKHILTISINQNDIFKLIDIDNIKLDQKKLYKETINGFDYINIDKLINSNNCKIEGEHIGNGLYAHIIYILAKSNYYGEFKEDFYIDNIPFTVGADFYNENESLYINLSNFGFEITDDVQKSIYPVNIHEDYKDNILINRKLKELLCNYWDIIANKGSYKSLLNSLNWFEWGELTKIKEIWQHDIGDKVIYDSRELIPILTDKYKETLSHFAKTTYISLYTSLEKYINNEYSNLKYDDELNPVLEFISTKWSFNDLSLKMSLLGKFYEMFFMPIHLDLIHSTIEDIVFTNTIKINQSTKLDRTDHIYNFSQVISNISDDDIFYITNIEQPIPSNTITAIRWNNNTYNILEINNDNEDDNIDYYSGAGTIIPIKIKIPIGEFDDFIKSEQISFNNHNNDWVTYKYYNIYNNKINNYIELDFNFICTREHDYELRIQLETANCKIHVINLKFKVSDINNIGIILYKYKKKNYLSPEDFGQIHIDIDNIEDIDTPVSNAIKFFNKFQYIPVNESADMGLNHVIVLDGDYTHNKNDFFNYYYTILYKKKDKLYTVCISKKFGFEPKEIPQFLLEVMYNNGYKYFSEFYTMTELKGNLIENYTILDNESLCISTNIAFGKYIKEYKWIFKNINTDQEYYPYMNIYSPFIIQNTVEMTPGYYDVFFKYKLIDGDEKVIKLNSAFIKK